MGYHNTGEGDLMALTIENEGPKKEARAKNWWLFWRFFLIVERRPDP